MSSTLLAILLLAIVILLWLDGARARELATAVVNELCRRRGYQLLDETVSLARLGLARTSSGLRLKRLFRFDYSIEGSGRQQGHILLHGVTVIEVDLVEPQVPEADSGHALDAASPTDLAQQNGGKVIPFRRPH